MTARLCNIVGRVAPAREAGDIVPRLVAQRTADRAVRLVSDTYAGAYPGAARHAVHRGSDVLVGGFGPPARLPARRFRARTGLAVPRRVAGHGGGCRWPAKTAHRPPARGGAHAAGTCAHDSPPSHSRHSAEPGSVCPDSSGASEDAKGQVRLLAAVTTTNATLGQPDGISGSGWVQLCGGGCVRADVPAAERWTAGTPRGAHDAPHPVPVVLSSRVAQAGWMRDAGPSRSDGSRRVVRPCPGLPIVATGAATTGSGPCRRRCGEHTSKGGAGLHVGFSPGASSSRRNSGTKRPPQALIGAQHARSIALGSQRRRRPGRPGGSPCRAAGVSMPVVP